MTTCTSCGKDNAHPLKFCADCGTRLPSPALVPIAAAAPVVSEFGYGVVLSPNCEACGAANPMRFRFCAACGSPIPEALIEVGGAEQSRAASLQHTAPPAAVVREPLPLTRSPLPPAVKDNGATDGPVVLAAYETRMGAQGVAPSAPKERQGLRLTRLGRDGRELGQNVVYDVFDIGRTEGNLVLPEDPTLSPRHARILRDGAHWQLADLRSSNGTFLRIRGDAGVESRQGVVLENGTTFWMGHQLLRFETINRSALSAVRLDDHTIAAGVDDRDLRARIVVCSRAQLALDVAYLRGEFVIGRESGHMVFPNDGYMSRRHAIIRQEDGQGPFRLYDLGSSNGTFVRIQSDVALEHHDQIRVGDQVFRAELFTNSGKDST